MRQKSKHHCVKSKHYGIMKRLYIITILAIICSMSAMAQNSPGMAHQNNGKDRWQIKGSFSRPSIQYDVINGEKILTVLNASGTCSLWINEYSTENIVFGPESVDGEYDEVNISCLETGKYTVCLRTSIGNIFRWVLDMKTARIIDGLSVVPNNPNSTNGGIWDNFFDY